MKINYTPLFKKSVLFLLMFIVFFNVLEVQAQCTSAQPSDFSTATPSTFDNTGYTSVPNSTGYVDVNTTGGGTNKADLRFQIDGTGRIQVRYNGAYHYYNSINPAQAITAPDDSAFNGLMVRYNGHTYVPNFSGSSQSEDNLYDKLKIKSIGKKGDGTTANPYKVRIEFYTDIGGSDTYESATEVLITEVNTYITGDKYIRRDRRVTIPNDGNVANKTVKLYDLRDAAFSGVTDHGYGVHSTSGIASAVNNPHRGNVVNDNLDFIGISSKLLSPSNSDAILLGLIEITPWDKWFTDQWNRPYDDGNTLVEPSSCPFDSNGSLADNQSFADNSSTPLYNIIGGGPNGDYDLTRFLGRQYCDIGFGVQYANLTTAGDHIVSVYEVVTTPCPPCNAGSTAPAFDAPYNTNQTITIACGSTTFDLSTITANNRPADATVTQTWHNGATASTTNEVSSTTVGAGTYYVSFKGSDGTNACYAPTTKFTVVADLCLTTPPVQQVEPNSGTQTGTLGSAISPTGGTSPYTYFLASSGCTAPSGGTTLTGVTVNNDGTYSYTAPTTEGTYYFCVEVCDSGTPQICKTETVQINVSLSSEPIAKNDTATVAVGGTSTVSVLANDTTASGDPANSDPTTGNVTLTQSSTTNAGVTLNLNGTVSVVAGTPAGTYFVYYQICDKTATSSCETASVAVTVPLDSDGDGVADADDLDKDNDGILDSEEGCEITGILPQVTALNERNSGDDYRGSLTDQSAANLGQTNGWSTRGAQRRGVHFGQLDGSGNTIPLTGAVNGTDGTTTVTANYVITQEPEQQGYAYTRYVRNNNGKIMLIGEQKIDATAANPDVLSFKIALSGVTSGYQSRVTLMQSTDYLKRFNNEASSWVFTWDGGGQATWYDDASTNTINDTTGTVSERLYNRGYPANPAYPLFDPNEREIPGLTTTGEISSGGTLEIYATTNYSTRWRIVFPLGATNIKVVKTTMSGGAVDAFSDNPAGGKDALWPKYGRTSGDGGTTWYNGESFKEVLTYQIDFIKDTDNDGIANCLDLDSDNDGCPDAKEGDADLEASNTDVGLLESGNAIAGSKANITKTSVNASGVPTLAGAGQTKGQSQDITKNDCADADGDGVADWADLDDDNDGILDTAECIEQDVFTDGFSYASGTSWTTTNSLSSQSGALFGTNPASSATNGLINTGNGSQVSTVKQAITVPAYAKKVITVDFSWRNTPATANSEMTIEFIYAGTTYGTIITSATDATGISWAGSNGAITVGAPSVGNAGSANSWTALKEIALVLPNTVPATGDFEVKMTSGANATTVDDIFINSIKMTYCNDTDGDGIPNHLDLDSDNDGCPDAKEGGSNLEPTNTSVGALESGNTTAGSKANITVTDVDANGVPTVATSAGQSIGNSQASSKNDCHDTDGDGVPDSVDLDNDNDGIKDTDEKVNCNGNPAYHDGSNATVRPSFTGGTGSLKEQLLFFDLRGITSVQFDNSGTTPIERTVTFNNVTYKMVIKNGHGRSTTAGGIGGANAANNTFKQFYSFGNSFPEYFILYADKGVSAGYTVELTAKHSNGTDLPVEVLVADAQETSSDERVRYHTTGSPFEVIESNGTLSNVLTGVGTQSVRYLNTMNNGASTNGATLRTKGTKDVSITVDYLLAGGTATNGPTGVAIAFIIPCDNDNDGIPNYLDLDSDNDGCVDAIEGGATNITSADLSTTASGTVTVGVGSTAENQNLGNTVGNTPTTMGIPTIAGTGQAIGISQAGAAITITQQPADLTVCTDEDAVFTAGATLSPTTATYNYKWQVSTDNGATYTNVTTTGGNIGVSGTASSGSIVTLTIASANVVNEHKYKVVITSPNNACGATSTEVTVYKNGITKPVITGGSTICKGDDPDPITVTTAGTSTSSAITYQWQKTTDALTASTRTWSNAGVNPTEIDPSTLTQTTYYRQVFSSELNGKTCSATSNEEAIIINTITAGAIQVTGTNVCSGSTVTLTQSTAASGYHASATIEHQWQSSTDNTNWANLFGEINEGYTATNLEQKTYFRRIDRAILNGKECTGITDVIEVGVEGTNPGVITPSNDAVCSGNSVNFANTTGAFSDTGITPTYSWEKSFDGNTWTEVAGQTTADYNSFTVTQTTYYKRKAVFTNGTLTCETETLPIKITIHGTTPGIIEDKEVCAGSPLIIPSKQDASGTGRIDYQWEFEDTSGSWIGVGGNSASLNTTGITQTTKYRRKAIFTDGTTTIIQCEAITDPITVTVNTLPTATISSNAQVCLNGTAPTITFTGANGTAMPYTFIYTINGGAQQSVTSTAANPTTATVNAPTNDGGEFTYKLIKVTDANCEQAVTGQQAVVTVYDLQPITISGNQTICEGDTPTQLAVSSTADAGASIDYRWEFSEDQTTWTAIVTNSAPANYVPTQPLTKTTYYRLVTVANDVSACEKVSNEVTVTVNPLPNSYPLTASPTNVCEGGTVTITLADSQTGVKYQLKEGTANVGAEQTGTAGTALNFVVANLTTGATYTIEATAPTGCNTTFTTTVSVGVNTLPTTTPNTSGVMACAATPIQTVTATATGAGANEEYVWFATATGGTATTTAPTLNAIGTKDYWVAVRNTTTGCIGANRAKGTLTISPTPAFVSTVTEVCKGQKITVQGNGTPATSMAYTSANTSIATVNATTGVVEGLADGTVTITYKNDKECTVAQVITVNGTPVKLSPLPTQNLCSVASPTVANLEPTPSTTIKWYTAETGGTALADTAPLANGTYWVAETNAKGCESERAEVTVTITDTPAAPQAVSPREFCENANPTLANLTANANAGGTIKWFATSTGGTALVSTQTLTSTTYYVSETVNDCEGARLAVTVTIKDCTAPTPSVVANPDGSVTVTPDTATNPDATTTTITYTSTDGTPTTLVLTKDAGTGNWTSSDPSISVNPTTGVVTIPADKVKDGTSVTAVSKDDAGNQGTATDTTPNPAPTPSVMANADGSVSITTDTTPNSDTNKTTITYVKPDGTTETAVLIKDSSGKWVSNNPDVVVDENTGVATIADDKVKDGTEVIAISEDEGGNSGTAKDTAKDATPPAPTVTANTDGSATVTPDTSSDPNATETVITYTNNDGATVTLTLTKDPSTGKWTSSDTTIPIDETTGVVTIPADKIKDGTEVKATSTDMAGLTGTGTDTVPNPKPTPDVVANTDGTVSITPDTTPNSDTNKTVITYTKPDGSTAMVTLSKNSSGVWVSDNTDVVITNPNTGEATIADDKIQDNTEVKAVSTDEANQTGEDTAIHNLDTDGDGVPDTEEIANGTDPNDPCSLKVANQTAEPNQAWKDADCDGDGVTNGQEKTDGTDPTNGCAYLVANQDVAKITDAWKASDCDGDGFTNGVELTERTNPNDLCEFPSDIAKQTVAPSTAWNNADCDNDGLTNGKEKELGTDPNNSDSDGDGVPDGKEVTDGTSPVNGCDYKVASQDVSAVSDTWKSTDCDNDGLTNGEEVTGVDDPSTPANPNGHKTDPRNVDTDGDGVSDAQEALDGTDPNNPCSYKKESQDISAVTDNWNNADCDNDGLTNGKEKELGTDPNNSDSDGDGVPDGKEVTEGTSPINGCDYKVASQDVSAVSDAWKSTDCDNDGLTNGEEVTGVDDPSTPADPKGNKTDPRNVDTDGDGVSDAQEALDGTDPNNPCSYKKESQDISAVTDNWNNADCDNDGLTNGKEKELGTDPNNSDSDGDGVPDGKEVTDGTSPINGCDYKVASQDVSAVSDAWKSTDCDNDGLTNGEEVTGVDDPSTPADPKGNKTDPRNVDTDGDGVSDAQEALDGTDPNDPCAYKKESQDISAVTDNWNNADCDNDGLTNGKEKELGTDPNNSDSDGDGVPDGKEVAEGTSPINGCDYKVASQDVSAVSDAWKSTDCDNDGLTNGEEVTGVDDPSTPANPNGHKTDPRNVDTDGDGVSDAQEALDGTDPNDPCAYKKESQDISAVTDNWNNADCDNDGLTNGKEKELGTDPNNSDSDGDGVPDGKEVAEGTSPVNGCDYKVASQDVSAVSDAWKSTDCDNDGLTNGEEVTGVDDPSTPANPNGNKTDPRNVDTDGDGVSDAQEALDGTDPNNPCSYKKESQDISAVTDNWNNADCDNDGLTNGKEKELGTDPNNSDSDGDGVPDGKEVTEGTSPINGCDYKVASQDVSAVSDAWKSTDCDNDGLTNGEEVTGVDDPSTPANPNGHKTDPRNVDTDGDGVSDAQEALDGTDPNDFCSFKKASQTTEPSTAWKNADCDKDGVTNGGGIDPENPPKKADLAVSKTVNNLKPRVNEEVEFTITVANLSDFEATGVSVFELLKSGYQYVSHSVSLGTYDNVTGVWAVGAIKKGSNAELVIKAKVNEEGDYTNTASIINADQADPNNANNSSEINSLEPKCLTVFNELTPNSDGKNDFLEIDCIDNYPDNTLEIFNRWGNTVYKKKGYTSNTKWTGISDGRVTLTVDDKLPTGTYFYVLDLGDGSPVLKGWIYISNKK